MNLHFYHHVIPYNGLLEALMQSWGMREAVGASSIQRGGGHGDLLPQGHTQFPTCSLLVSERFPFNVGRGTSSLPSYLESSKQPK